SSVKSVQNQVRDNRLAHAATLSVSWQALTLRAPCFQGFRMLHPSAELFFDKPLEHLSVFLEEHRFRSLHRH
ncbi:hypothetical protein, partial [Delftia sp. WSY_7]|uniref:hypothetical protein n=1 Tax=Delftia sp. WSY_7 TaxID=3367202 RepID=UPI00370BC898